MLCMCHGTCIVGQKTTWEPVFSFYHMSPGDQTEVVKLGSQCLYSLSRPLIPFHFSFNFVFFDTHTHTRAVQGHCFRMAPPPSPSPDSNDLWPPSVNDSQSLSCPAERALVPVCNIGYSRKFLTERDMHNIGLLFLSFFLLFLSFPFCAG